MSSQNPPAGSLGNSGIEPNFCVELSGHYDYVIKVDETRSPFRTTKDYSYLVITLPA